MPANAYNISIMIVAGLTGNYGMGKSSVLSMFASLGAVTLDCDEIVKRLLDEKGVISEIGKMLGGEVVDEKGKLNKKSVAEKVFRDASARKRLEDFIHPLVFDKIDAFLSGIEDSGKVIVIEVPLLFEGGHTDRFKKTITVYTSNEEAIRRLSMAGVSPEEAQARLAAQMPAEEKVCLSDYAINNNGLPEDTKRQVETIYKKLVAGTG